MTIVRPGKESLVTAEKFVQYKREGNHIGSINPPKAVVVCYQSSTFRYFAELFPHLKQSEVYSHLHLLEGSDVGIFGDFGVGAPALAIGLEQLIVHGMTKFVAVGTAGSLGDFSPGSYVIANKALAEDGVAHHYLLSSKNFIDAPSLLERDWERYVKVHDLEPFHKVTAWSHSAMFKESAEDVVRVKALGCGIVEMEAATLFAIGQEKGVDVLSLFTISDEVTPKGWVPHLKEPIIRDRLHDLAKMAFDFAEWLP